MMITFGFRNKFSGWLRAAIAIIIGCIMVIKPSTALVILVYVVASIMVASGIVSLAYGLKNRRNGGLGLLIFNTVVNILIGILLFAFPEAVASFAIILIGIVLVLFGIFQIAAMVSASSLIPVGFWSFVLPIVCTGGGILLLFNPFGAGSTITLVAGAAVIVYGLSELFASWKMSRAMHEYDIRFPSPDGKDGSSGYEDVKDADFEKVDSDDRK